MSGYGCPIEPCSARYVHRQSLKRHLLAFHHMVSDINDGLRPVSPATIERIAPGMRRSAENSRQRRSRWAVERAVAAAVSSDGPPDPRSPVGFIRPRPDSGEIPSGGAVIEDLGRRRLRRNATVGRGGTKVPSSSPSAAWCYSPRRDESVVTPSAAESAAAFRIRGPLPHLRSRSSSPNFFGRPSGSRPASDVDSSDELGTWPAEVDGWFLGLPDGVAAGTQTCDAPLPVGVAASSQTELSVPALSSPFPLPWGTTPAAIADLAVNRPDLVPIRIVWALSSPGLSGAAAEEADLVSPAADLADSVLELAASVAVATVARVRVHLLHTLMDSLRRDPTGASVLRDCGLSLEPSRH